MKRKLVLPVMMMWAIGCGSSGDAGMNDGGGGGINDGGLTPGQGTITWKDNGSMRTSLIAAAVRVKAATQDMVQVTGANSTGDGVSFGVSKMPPLLPGTYTCGTDPATAIVTIVYQAGNSSSSVPTSCTIGIEMIGDATGTHVKGTFSAVATLDNGMVKTVTEGKFDVPLTVSSL